MSDESGPSTLWVDVSEHDWNRRGGNLDWPSVLAVTSPVMCARATYGDPGGWHRSSQHFGDFQQGAAAAGFTVRGGYHNLVRGDAASMRRQVDWLRRELDTYGCTWGMADVERYPELLNASMWPRYEDVLRFHDAWYAADDRVMAWYVPRWVWSYWGNADLTVLRGPLVQSHYADGVYGSAASIYEQAGGNSGTGWDDAYGGRLPDAWQFTALADVDGASNQTDVNAYRGTLAELAALLTGDIEMSGILDGQHGEALMWNVNALVYDLDVIADGPRKGDPNLLKARLVTLSQKLDALAKVGGPEAAALLREIDERFEAQKAEIRDAVADLGEGGAAQVRADAE